MDSRIEAYFGKELSDEERVQFEREIKENPELADDVAFYLAARKAQADGRAEELKARHGEWQKLLEAETPEAPAAGRPRPLYRAWAAAAAIVVLVAGLAWYLNLPAPGYGAQAHAYVASGFQTVSVQMSGGGDSLQHAVDLFNKGDLSGASEAINRLLATQPGNAEVKKLAGIVSLRLKEYDKAIEHFSELGAREDLFSNPGKFYEALALLERGKQGDKERAEGLLKEVVEQGLEGKEVVVEWE